VEESLHAETSSIRPVVSIQYRLVTDGWTDRRTRDDSIYRASIVSRGKNPNSKRGKQNDVGDDSFGRSPCHVPGQRSRHPRGQLWAGHVTANRPVGLRPTQAAAIVSGCRSAKFRSAEVTDPRNDHADTAIQRVSSVDRWRRKQRAVRTA